MADVSILSRLVNGVQRNVDLSSNTIVVNDIKVGGSGGTVLTQAILNRLISLQDGSDIAASYHTHDGRYFTETELGSSSASSGSDLVGDDNTYSNFTPSAATVKGALAGIDSALASAGGGLVKVSAADTTSGYLGASIPVDNGSNASNPLESSIINPGANETYRIRFDQSKVDHGSITGLGDDDHTIYIKADGTRAFSGNQAMGNNKITGLAAATANGDAVRYEQLTALESLIQNFEFQASALDYITDNTVAPPTEVSGDRYLLSDNGGTPHANWDGAEAGDIVEFNGSIWVETNPTVGMIISVDDESTSLRQWSGSAWSQKYFEATTASTGLTKVGFDIRLDASSAGSGLGFSSGVLAVNTGDGIEIATDAVKVKVSDIAGAGLEDDGSNNLRIASTVAGGGLTHSAGVLAVGAGDGIDVAADAISVDVSDLAGTGLENDGSNNLRIAAAAAGAGLTGGAGSALSVVYAPSIQAAGEIAGEAYSATTLYAVRYGQNAETAGRLYKADNDATSTDNMYAIGLVLTVGALSAADPMPNVVKMGPMTVTGHGFTVGKPVYLGASGALTSTAPTTSNLAVVRVGMVKSANIIDVNVQVVGVN
jgi:hypothetical protein